jgi:hypothetical protein
MISTALAEKMSALLTEEYFRERRQRASRTKFLAALAKVLNVDPEDHDRLESSPASKRRSPPVVARLLEKKTARVATAADARRACREVVQRTRDDFLLLQNLGFLAWVVIA